MLFLMFPQVYAAERLRIATTTSTENTGLLAILHPPFEKQYKVKLDVIAVGSGKALRLGENGDVDVVMVHAPEAERVFMEKGFGLFRQPLMHNDFVLLGPLNDPAQLKIRRFTQTALRQLASSGQTFISRGDNSGTHKKEMELWALADIEPVGDWYWSVGQGMGMVLQMSQAKQAYTLSDRGTYLAYKDKLDLQVVLANDPILHNPYHVMIVNPKQHAHINAALAKQYVEYLISPIAQQIIKDFQLNGEALFIPNALD